MAQAEDKADHKKSIIIGVVSLVVLVGGYIIIKKRSSSTATTSSPNGIVTSNTQAVAAQTLNPGIITLTPGSGDNLQGNYGDDSSSGYMQALSEEAAISKQLSTLESQPKAA